MALPISISDSLQDIQDSMSLICYFMLVVSATYLFTIIPDRPGDLATGKKTLAALITDSLLTIVASILLAASIVLALTVGYVQLAFISIAAILVYIPSIFFVKPKLILFACKLPILLLTLLAGWYYPVYMILIFFLLLATRLYYKKRFGIVYPRLN